MSRRQKNQFNFGKFLREWGGFILIMGLFLISRYTIWNPVTVEGHSMDPTLKDREMLIVMLHTDIERFDVVVANSVDDNGETKKIVKRVIGMPGDVVNFNNDVLTINGEVVDEPYLAEYLAAFKKDKLQETYSYNSYFQELALKSQTFTTDANYNSNFTVTVPEGQYFLVGDDRIVSKDSRHVGTYSEESLVGEVKVRYWPITNMDLF
ncbi:signal peptidase I [Streptococcus moroccensis]|uniref:Signal peptidase I n=1 Tax=Streptococcus moroccensis TaxID=1451356 RepID=A0ABT9YTN2_9STRE|nr:signal peptidase I [Streptococcus moroccensis]MDQ0222967.1 signal peptidase I [Streptococcus moroccensis]